MTTRLTGIVSHWAEVDSNLLGLADPGAATLLSDDLADHSVRILSCGCEQPLGLESYYTGRK
jgi:hypothetical protein